MKIVVFIYIFFVISDYFLCKIAVTLKIFKFKIINSTKVYALITAFHTKG